MDLCFKKIIIVMAGLMLNIVCLADTKPLIQHVVVSEAYIRALPPGVKNTAAFMQVHNKNDTTLTLNKLTSSVADRVEVHQSFSEHGQMKMRTVNHLTWQPHETIHFTPGAYHIMFIGLNQTLIDGQKVDLNICFGDFCQKSELTVMHPGHHNHHDHSTTHTH